MEGAIAKKKYASEKHASDIKQIKSDTDIVSALLHLTREAFQLEATFYFKEMSGANSRNRFACTVSFHQTVICSCSGQNKQESKKAAA